MTRVRPVLLAAAACAAIAAVVGARASAEAPAKRIRPLDPKERQELIPSLHRYLDLSSDKTFEGRTQMIGQLARLLETGEDLLADVDAMQGLVYAARPFAEPLIAKRNLPKDLSKEELKHVDIDDADPYFTSIKWDEHVKMSVSLPKSYPLDPKKTTEHAPYPTIVTLHELEDYQDARAAKRFPGAEVIKRRWDPRGPMKAVTDEWIVVAPVTPRAKFMNDDGSIVPESVPAAPIFHRYHVDFDRIVLDGGSDALAFAAARSLFYAGVIVRGDKADVKPALVRNFANLSVYVVGTDASAAVKSLKAGGFPMDHVKVGGADGIAAWLKGVHRVVPKSFSWTIGDRDTMTFAHWVNVNAMEEGVPTLEVEVVDTADDPNTIRLKTKLVRAISIFLSDRIVDLDRPVRVIVNGKPAEKPVVVVGGRDEKDIKLPAKLDRSFDLMFDNQGGIPVRKTQYFGWIYAAQLGATITTDDAPPPSATPASALPPPPAEMSQAEQTARQYYEKAEQAEKDGNVEQARKLYGKALEQGDTTIKANIEARLKALEAPPPKTFPKPAR